MNKPIELYLEQEFSIRSFALAVQQMSREQAQEFLIEMHKQMVIQKTMYEEFLKHKWNLA